MEIVLLLLGAIRAVACRQADLVVENLLLRHQLAALTRPGRRRPRLRCRDRLIWLAVRRLVHDWQRHLVIVEPRTVVRWHRQAWKLFWRWKSARPGRPRLSAEVRGLITAMSWENPLWGTERIRGELLKLGISVSNRSIRRYRWRGPKRSPSQTWRTFLANHRPQIWAADLLTIQTLTFRTLYIFFFITHDRRELVHFNVTANPTAAWVWRQLLEATAWGRKPRFLIRDRDRVYGGDFIHRAKGLGVTTLLSPIRAPRANAIAERVVRTLRADCLAHLIVLDERHLIALLREYVSYYNTERPHRSLCLQPPTPVPRPQSGPVRSHPVLGGLHHVYERAA